MKTKAKLKKSSSSGGVKSPNGETSSSEMPDLTQLRKPIDINLSSLKQVAQLLEKGSEEVQALLTYECDVVYECRICRSLFRSLANFISHKRVYCVEKYNVVSCRRIASSVEPINDYISFSSNFFLDPEYKENCTNDRILRSQSTKPEPKKDLTSVVEMLTKKRKNDSDCEINVETNIDELQDDTAMKVSSDGEQVLLEVIDSKQAAYQTLIKSNNPGANCDTVPMKSQTLELKDMSSRNTAVLGPDGQILTVDTDTVENESQQRNKGNFRTKSQPSSDEPISCTICKATFGTRKTLTFHIQSKHMPQRMCYPCPCCTSVYTNRWSVYRHLFKVHRKTNDQVRKLRAQIQATAYRKESMRLERVPRDGSFLSKEDEAEIERAEKETQEWLESLEVDLEQQRCQACGRHFDRKASLLSHSLICKKRREGRDKRASKNPPQRVVEDEESRTTSISSNDGSTIVAVIGGGTKTPRLLPKPVENVSINQTPSLITTKTPLLDSKTAPSPGNPKITPSPGSLKTAVSQGNLKPVTSLVLSKPKASLLHPKKTLSLIGPKITLLKRATLLSTKPGSPLSNAKAMAVSVLSKPESTLVLTKPALVVPVSMITTKPTSAPPLQKIGSPVIKKPSVSSTDSKAASSSGKPTEISIRVEGVSSLSKDVWDKIGTSDDANKCNPTPEKSDCPVNLDRPTDVVKKDAPQSLDRSTDLVKKDAPQSLDRSTDVVKKEAPASKSSDNPEVPDLIYTSIDNSRPVALSVLGSETKLGIQYRGIRLPTVTLEKITIPPRRVSPSRLEPNVSMNGSQEQTSVTEKREEDFRKPSELRKLQCLPCNRRFMSMTNLRRHVAIHVRRNRYRCKICDFQAVLKCHIVAHCNRKHDAKNDRSILADMMMEVPFNNETFENDVTSLINKTSMESAKRELEAEKAAALKNKEQTVSESSPNQELTIEKVPQNTRVNPPMIDMSLRPKRGRPPNTKRKLRRGRRTKKNVVRNVSPPRLPDDDSSVEMEDIEKLADERKSSVKTPEISTIRAPSRLDRDPELRKMVMEVIFGSPQQKNVKNESEHNHSPVDDNEMDLECDEVIEDHEKSGIASMTQRKNQAGIHVDRNETTNEENRAATADRSETNIFLQNYQHCESKTIAVNPDVVMFPKNYVAIQVSTDSTIIGQKNHVATLLSPEDQRLIIQEADNVNKRDSQRTEIISSADK